MDVGSDAADRAFTLYPYYTYIDRTNPADYAGTIDIVDLYFAIDAVGCVVAIFENTGTQKYKVRSRAVLGNVTAGSKQTFSGLSLSAEVGDVIGVYYTASGQIDMSNSGGGGVLYLAGDKTAVDLESTFSVSDADGCISIYGHSTIQQYTRNAAVTIGVLTTASRNIDVHYTASTMMGLFITNAIALKGVIIRSAFVKIGFKVSSSAGKRAFGYVLKRYAKFASKTKTVRFIE